MPEPDRGFLLAHFSDPHIAPLPPASLRDLSSKRILGFLSWRYRRRHLHRLENLDRLAADVIAQAPDHVAITGDLTNISLPSEFAQAATWLEGFGAADWVTVIPGNHDAYVRQPWAQSWALWADYMSGDDRPHRGFDDFPFVRRRDHIAIIGLSSAVPTLPTLASGRLGPGQLVRLESCLEALGAEGRFRTVLIHHPPVPGLMSARKALSDAAAFRDVIARTGAELVLHGHDHSFTVKEIAGPEGPVPVCGVPSASSGPGGHKPLAQYHLYRIAPKGKGWSVEMRVRAWRGPGAGFTEQPAVDLSAPALGEALAAAS